MGLFNRKSKTDETIEQFYKERKDVNPSKERDEEILYSKDSEPEPDELVRTRRVSSSNNGQYKDEGSSSKISDTSEVSKAELEFYQKELKKAQARERLEKVKDVGRDVRSGVETVIKSTAETQEAQNKYYKNKREDRYSQIRNQAKEIRKGLNAEKKYNKNLQYIQKSQGTTNSGFYRPNQGMINPQTGREHLFVPNGNLGLPNSGLYTGNANMGLSNANLGLNNAGLYLQDTGMGFGRNPVQQQRQTFDISSPIGGFGFNQGSNNIKQNKKVPSQEYNPFGNGIGSGKTKNYNPFAITLVSTKKKGNRFSTFNF